MPVCNSIFDRESAADCFAEMMTLPRVASGRCKVAAIGMRLDARTRAAEVLETWARGLKLPFIGVLREAQAYVRCVEQGLTVFDLPDAQAQADTAQWKPIVAWLEPVLRTVHRRALRGNPSVAAARCPSRRPCRSTWSRPRTWSTSSPTPFPAAPAPAGKTVAPPAPPRPAIVEPPPRAAPVRLGLFGWLTAPRFLHR